MNEGDDDFLGDAAVAYLRRLARKGILDQRDATLGEALGVEKLEPEELGPAGDSDFPPGKGGGAGAGA